MLYRQQMHLSVLGAVGIPVVASDGDGIIRKTLRSSYVLQRHPLFAHQAPASPGPRYKA